MRKLDWDEIFLAASFVVCITMCIGLICIFLLEPEKLKIQHSNNQAALVLLNHFLLHR